MDKQPSCGEMNLCRKINSLLLCLLFRNKKQRFLCLPWQEFAGEGLRTLAIAYRDLDDQYFKEWQKMLEDANASANERDEWIAGLYEEIERDLMV